MNYGKYGRGRVLPKEAVPAEQPLPPPPELTGWEFERARQMRNTCHAILPEAVPFIADMVKHGLIYGWRDVADVRPLQPNEKRATP